MVGGFEGGLGFDGRQRLLAPGGEGAALGGGGRDPEQLTNQVLLVALPVGGGHHLQTHQRGAHGLAEHLLGPGEEEKEGRGEEGGGGGGGGEGVKKG